MTNTIDNLDIRTNNIPRDIIQGFELPASQYKEFDYYSKEEFENASFFKYRGHYYDLGEIMRTEIEGWDGIHSDTYFSGLLVKFTPCNEYIIIATCYSH